MSGFSRTIVSMSRTLAPKGFGAFHEKTFVTLGLSEGSKKESDVFGQGIMTVKSAWMLLHPR